MGDLSLKQGKHAEAEAAYEKLLAQKPDDKNALTVRAKLAQVKMAQAKYDAAERLMQEVLQLQKKAAEASKLPQPPVKSAEPARSPLPGKLIITAPKKLLEQASKLSLEDFQKQATVEYVNVPTTK